MAVIEAPLSRYKKNNLLIWIVLLVGLAAWFAYDGYKSPDFIKKHTLEDGQPDSTLLFNRRAPFAMVGAAIAIGIYLFLIKDKKLIADENALHADKLEIPYAKIESINKTYFDKKGYFLLTYKDDHQQVQELKLSDRTYDNLGVLLDTLISKIS